MEHTGWLLDLYADPQGGVVLWLLGDDGQRYRFQQTFPITFYAAGPPERLRALWRFLENSACWPSRSLNPSASRASSSRQPSASPN